MPDINPGDAKFVGDLVSKGSGTLGELVSKVTGWIADFIGGLGWFEWSIIICILVISVVYIVLKRKVDELKNISRSKFYGRRKFK